MLHVARAVHAFDVDLLQTERLTNGDHWKEGHGVIDSNSLRGLSVGPRSSLRALRDSPHCGCQLRSLG